MINVVKHLINIDPRSITGEQVLTLPVDSRFLSLGPDTWGYPAMWFAEPPNVEVDVWTIRQAHPGNNTHIGRYDEYLGVIVEENSVRHYFATKRPIAG